MHDFLEVLGVPSSARALEVRRRCAGYVRRWHPDFGEDRTADPRADDAPRDVAIDFVDMSAFVNRMHVDFFADPTRR